MTADVISVTAISCGRTQSPLGVLTVACGGGALLAVALPNQGAAWLAPYLQRPYPGAALEDGAGDAVVQECLDELQAYFAGRLHRFDVMPRLRGTPFQIEVWQALQRVPYGESRSYAQLATALMRPRAARAVGHANAANPIPIVVPCHRLVGSDGGLTGYAGGLDAKRWLLRFEARNRAVTARN